MELTDEEVDRINAFARLMATKEGKALMVFLRELEQRDNLNFRVASRETLEKIQGKAERLKDIIDALTLAERTKEKSNA